MAGPSHNSATSTPISPRNSSLIAKLAAEESDEELFRVPDVETQQPAQSRIDSDAAAGVDPSLQGVVKRRRGRAPLDKEYRRLKRLLRNRVSAQQARERKKMYVNELESRAIELQDANLKLEEKISTLTNENAMLRKVLVSTRPKVDESSGELA